MADGPPDHDRHPSDANRLVWLTDLHLDAARSRSDAWSSLATALRDAAPDLLLVGGDVSTASELADDLFALGHAANAAVAFVLGNHDFYGSEIEVVETWAREVSAAPDDRRAGQLHWLDDTAPRWLADRVALVGVGGWGDGGWGAPGTSTVRLNDWRHIADLSPPRVDSIEARNARCRELGHIAAARLRSALEDALEHDARSVLVLSHVPPSPDTARYADRPADGAWAPWFCCRAVHDLLLQVAARHPTVSFLMLAGHSHHEADVWLADNLRVAVAPATYGEPCIAGIVEIAESGVHLVPANPQSPG